MKGKIGSNGRYIYVVDLNNNYFVVDGSVVGVIDGVYCICNCDMMA
jgi:hypothetical protein